jgi:hypothetical protein
MNLWNWRLSNFPIQESIFLLRSLPALVNSDYPKSLISDDESDPTTTLDYKSLLSMATRTSTSAITVLKWYQETLSLLDQPTTKRQPLTITNHDSILPISHVTIPSAKTITFKENISTLPNDSIIEEIRHNNEHIERIKSDLSKQIIFSNGSKQDITSDDKQIRV